MAAAPRRFQQPRHAGRGRAAGRGEGGGRHGRAGAHREQGRDKGAAPAAAGRGVVGAHLGQPGHLRGPAGEQRHGGEGRGEPAGEPDQQVVPAVQVGSLVRQHGPELRAVENSEGPAAEHDRGRPAGHAVRDRLRRIEHDGGAGARQPAAGDPGDGAVRASLPPGPQHAAPVSPGRYGRHERGEDRDRAQGQLEDRAPVDRRAARSSGDRAAEGLRQPGPARDGRRDQELQRHRRRGQHAQHRGQPARQAQPGADAPAGQPQQQPRQAPRHRERVAEHQQCGPHPGRPPDSRRTTARSTSDSGPPIWATK
jgi:hypothetical protein